jgi:hypothetical protein
METICIGKRLFLYILKVTCIGKRLFIYILEVMFKLKGVVETSRFLKKSN